MKSLSRFLVGLLSCAWFLSHSGWSQSAGWTPELAMQVKRVSHVRVSPDGKRVVFVVAQAMMESEKSEWLSHIYVAASDGTGMVQLTQGEKSATFPEWSPDGQWIAFLSARGSQAGNEDQPLADSNRRRGSGTTHRRKEQHFRVAVVFRRCSDRFLHDRTGDGR